MGRESDLPKSIAVLGSDQNPWRSVLFVGVIAVLVAGFVPFDLSIAVSSFATLLYYAIANLSALRLRKQQRTFPTALSGAGLVGCIGLAFSLSTIEIGMGIGLLVAGLLYRGLRLALAHTKKQALNE